MNQSPRIGLVVPQPIDVVPPEGPVMYPDVTFVPRGTGVTSLTPGGYDDAVDKIVPAADYLAKQGVDAIMVVGTSLTFYRGPEFNDHLQREIRNRTGLPVSTMSSAILEGLRTVRATRLAVATAYTDVVNQRLDALLQFHDFQVEAIAGFDITDFDAVSSKSKEEIIALSLKVPEKAPGADAMLISCGGLQTLNVIKPLEQICALPVVSSTQATFWSAMRLSGLQSLCPGYGRLLESA